MLGDTSGMLVDTLNLLTGLREIPAKELANITTNNAESYFDLARSMS
jgi:hypothetical protein